MFISQSGIKEHVGVNRTTNVVEHCKIELDRGLNVRRQPRVCVANIRKSALHSASNNFTREANKIVKLVIRRKEESTTKLDRSVDYYMPFEALYLLLRPFTTWVEHRYFPLAMCADCRKFISTVFCQDTFTFEWRSGIHANIFLVVLGYIFPPLVLSFLFTFSYGSVLSRASHSPLDSTLLHDDSAADDFTGVTHISTETQTAAHFLDTAQESDLISLRTVEM
ncbi:hypothetical protein ACTXT7_010425 [Hymenolepis weldensis]